MRLPVLCVADGAAWEERLVAAFDAGEHPVAIVRRCVDVVDLLAVAGSGQVRAALVAPGLRRLDVDAIEQLHAAGVVAVGVTPRGDDVAENHLRSLGVRHLVPADAEPGVVAAVIGEAVRTRGDEPAARTIDRAFADSFASQSAESIPPGGAEPEPADEPVRHGSVIAVWGPTGAPGRTTVAVALADELARLGAASLLVDADVFGGTIAAVLGLLDESPGLAAACRQAAANLLEPAALAALSWQLGPQLRVLTGIPIASRWPELRPQALASVLVAARRLADFTVLDLGFCLETDEELSFDTIAPRRNGATLAALDDADLVIVVGAADPVGMQRLVRGLVELREAGIDGTQWVLLNRVRDTAVPGDPALELTAALERFAGRTPAALLPWDPRALDVALATGRSLSESSPHSPLRRAVVEVAGKLAGVERATARRRRR